VAAVIVVLVGFAVPKKHWIFAVVFLVLCPVSVLVGVGGCCCHVSCHDRQPPRWESDRKDDDDADLENPAKGKETKQHRGNGHDDAGTKHPPL